VTLAVALTGLSEQIKRATEAAFAQSADWDEYSETEKRSMVLIGALKNVNGVDLMALELRFSYLQEIERTNALTAHPEHYSTLGEMAAQQGISVAELSKIKDLCGIVFPYIQDTLGLNVAQLWENTGKSKMFEILPVLKCLITGEPSETGTVNSSVDRFIEDATATDLAAGIDVVEDDALVVNDRQISRRGIRQQIVEGLLQDAEQMPTRELRERARPDRTPSIQALVINRAGRKVVVTDMDPGQFEMLTRRLSGHMDVQQVDLPEDRRMRQEILFNRREYRNLLNMTEE